MAGWGEGSWGLMPWGGIFADVVSYLIKILHIRVRNYVPNIKIIKKALYQVASIKAQKYLAVDIKQEKYLKTNIIAKLHVPTSIKIK
jgi:hypothetical protein